ncbi:MAG: hypothetical protein Q9219_000154 [cf. Caloplaca sp. 3 TL-2023]
MSSSPNLYNTLIAHLSPYPPTILEIEILPSSLGPDILSSPPSIGIPKALLLSSFLHARTVLLSYLMQESVTANSDINGEARIATRKEALDSTIVILLYDAGYTSAVNLRKRWLCGLGDALLSAKGEDLAEQQRIVKEAVHGEIIWLESLLTSPLFRHAKASTLWAHRLWVLRLFPSELVSVLQLETKEDRTVSREENFISFMERELDVVMRAGERHPGNYHAWNYARDMIRLSVTSQTKRGKYQEIEPGREPWTKRCPATESAWKSHTEKVHKWCLAHPRDISGWAFLFFLLDQHTLLTKNGGEAVIRQVFQGTAQFKENLEWKGRSLDWFMASACRFSLDTLDVQQCDSNASI